MSVLKQLAIHLLPQSVLMWGKKHYYLYAVSRFWEADIEPIKCLIKPGDFTVDLGANVGWYTALFARLVGERGKVYSVEPIPGTFGVLSTVVQKLKLSNVELFNCAVSDKDGSGLMEIPKHEYGGANFYMAHIIGGQSLDPALDQVEVPLHSLDSLIPKELAMTVTFIKCDVEGHELAVLKGATELMKRARPAMMIEVAGTAAMQDAPNNEFFSLLRGYGYTPFWFDGKVLRKREKGHWSVNYFFLQPGHLPRVAHLLVS